MRLLDPLADLTDDQVELRYKRAQHDDAKKHNYTESNKYHHSMMIRQALKTLVELEIMYDEFDNPRFTTLEGFIRALSESAAAAAEVILYYAKEYRTWQDDHEDYTRAAAQQIGTVQAMLSDDNIGITWQEVAKPLERAMAMSREELEDSDFYCFKLGYADHGSTISTLLAANYEEF